ncbi:hypothetical protein [Dactylosporangium sp. NPDC005555]|uniref:hypothetical protein n=1 Tax=Dactylosporangium sp. NPDC005555 TaxID=3154889 RepID=UPI0033BE0662
MQPEADESVPELAAQPDDEPPAPAPPLSPQINFRANTGGTPAATLASMWNDSDRQRIRGRWQELQAKFLDDPHLVAGEAERLVQEAVASLTASLDARRSQLHQQRASRGVDTENLRASLRDYREFLDRILGL